MSKMLSILALSGNKDAAITAAADQVRDASLQLILHGNSRNFTDTIDALASAGGRTKGGDIAKSRKGAIMGCLIDAMNGATSASLTVRPIRKGAPTAEEKANGARAADAIAEAFETAARTAIAPKVKAVKVKVQAAPATDATAAPVSDATAAPPLLRVYDAPYRLATAKRLRALRARVREQQATIAALQSVIAEMDAKKRGKVKKAA